MSESTQTSKMDLLAKIVMKNHYLPLWCIKFPFCVQGNGHCVKSVPIRSYSGPHFPAFGLNTERCGVSLYMQSKCGKMRTRITRNTDAFYAVSDLEVSSHILLVMEVWKGSFKKYVSILHLGCFFGCSL